MAAAERAIVVSETGRGLLDISVDLSTADLTANKEFSVYVSVKNPYASPVWIRNVTVSVPSEVELPQWITAEKKLTGREQESAITEAEKAAKRDELITDQAEREVRIENLKKQLNAVAAKQSNIKDETEGKQLQDEEHELLVLIKKEELTIAHLQSELTKVTTAGLIFNANSKITTIEVSNDSQAAVEFNAKAEIGEIRVGRSSVNDASSAVREVDLASSLPPNVPLQPGDTAVYTVIFRTKSNLLFRPAQYKLHFNVAYYFSIPSELRVNTTSTTLSIRASISSIMAGALLGGLTGFAARQLQTVHSFRDFANATTLFTLMVSLILSAVAVVFIARKSEAQSFVSVEDFWGGVLIGFLVGYSGVAAFQSIAGVKLQ